MLAFIQCSAGRLADLYRLYAHRLFSPSSFRRRADGGRGRRRVQVRVNILKRDPLQDEARNQKLNVWNVAREEKI
jgi:hypothetical protein